MLFEELNERLLVQESLGLLIEESLICRATTLGEEEKLVLHTRVTTVDINLCREVCAAVVLIGHRDRYNLRVAEIALLVCLVNTARDILCVLCACPNIFALVSNADCSTCILTSWQLTLGCYARVHQHCVGYELVVVGSLLVLQDVAQLLQVCRTEVERHIGISLLCEEFDTLWIDLQNLATIALNDLHIILRQKTILCVVTLDWERLLIDKF